MKWRDLGLTVSEMSRADPSKADPDHPLDSSGKFRISDVDRWRVMGPEEPQHEHQELFDEVKQLLIALA